MKTLTLEVVIRREGERMSNRKQLRKWNLTINEPIEKEWTHD